MKNQEELPKTNWVVKENYPNSPYKIGDVMEQIPHSNSVLITVTNVWGELSRKNELLQHYVHVDTLKDYPALFIKKQRRKINLVV